MLHSDSKTFTGYFNELKIINKTIKLTIWNLQDVIFYQLL